ncbi:hypothetical protein GCM10019016_103370 [Streptomyces prasinosporus]|uniref:Uncharacterized protein n=1 Tax=Streptomyces prasinosporus TaxID=68256 RepID=A0ABP6U699_9ACTN
MPMPCTTAAFVEYVGHLAERDLVPSSVQVRMSAIRPAHPDGQQPGTSLAVAPPTRAPGRAVTAHGLRRGPAQGIFRSGRRPDRAGSVEAPFPHGPQAPS